MPYKSEAQRGYMHAAAERGDIPKKVVREFDRASKGQHDLPYHVKKKHEYAYGGEVKDICPHCGAEMGYEGVQTEDEEEMFGRYTDREPSQTKMDDYQRKKALFQQSFRGR